MEGLPLPELLQILSDANAAARRGEWRDLALVVERSYEDMVSIRLCGERPETDQERAAREATEKSQKAWTEERQRAEYERLKKLYGDGR